jgi:hypothetical protein
MYTCKNLSQSKRELGSQLVLKKEVIQPHLPIGLPCYDFILVISLTLDTSLSEELSQWLRVKPTSMM